MSWLDRLRESFRPRTHPPVRSPTAAFPTPVSLFERLLEELTTNWHEDGWAHFEVEPVEQGDLAIVVQVSPPDIVNTCNDEVDVPALLRTAGLTVLADMTQPVKGDATLHRAPDAALAEVAQIVHVIFAVHHGLGEHYEVRGWLEG